MEERTPPVAPGQTDDATGQSEKEQGPNTRIDEEERPTTQRPE